MLAPCNLTINHRLQGDAVEAVNIYREVFESLDPTCKADPTRATLTTLVLTVTDGTVGDVGLFVMRN